MSFDDLLQKIAENDYSQVVNFNGSYEQAFQNFFDWIDDSLLSLIIQFQANPENIDDYFRQTLAYIQARELQGLTQDDVVAFLKARCAAIKEKIAPKPEKWKAFVSSGLPLASAIEMSNVFTDIETLRYEYEWSEQNIADKVDLLKNIEAIMQKMPSIVFKNCPFSKEDIDKVRAVWLDARNLGEVQILTEKGKVQEDKPYTICSKYFAYTVSWFLGAIANKYKTMALEPNSGILEENAAIFEELAICCELGVPSMKAAKIYLGGINSRGVATAISETSVFDDYDSSESIANYKAAMIENKQIIKTETNQPAIDKWLEILTQDTEKSISIPKRIKIGQFIKEISGIVSNRLFFKKIGSDFFLCNSDYTEKYAITADPQIASYINKIHVFFEREDSRWRFVNLRR